MDHLGIGWQLTATGDGEEELYVAHTHQQQQLRATQLKHCTIINHLVLTLNHAY